MQAGQQSKKALALADDGIALYKSGRFSEAQRTFQTAVRFGREEALPFQQMCELLNHLAVVHTCLSKYLDAESNLKEAFALLDRASSLEAPGSKLIRAVCLSTFANLHYIHNKYVQMEEMLNEAIELLESENNLIYAGEMVWQIAVLRHEQAMLEEGTVTVNRLEQMYKRLAEKRPEKVTRAYRDEACCGWPRFAFGWDEKPYFQEIEHESAVKISMLRAGFSQALSEAKMYCEEGLSICCRVESVPEFYLARLLAIKSDLARDSDERTKADELAVDAAELAERLYGKRHPALAGYLLKMVGAKVFVERRNNYEKYVQDAMAILLESFGERHYSTARALIMSSDFMALQGMNEKTLQERESLIKRGLDTLSDIFAETHPDVVKAEVSLAEIFRATGRLEEAEELIQGAIAKLQGQAESVQLLLNIRRTLVNFYLRLGRDDELLAALGEQKQLIATLTMTKPQRVGRMMELAYDFSSIGKYDDAEALLKEGLALTAEGDDWHKAFVMKLAQLYADSDRENEAREILSTITLADGNAANALQERFKVASILCVFDPDEAMKRAQEVFDIACENLPECAQPFGFAAALLIEEYLRTDRLDDAHRISNVLLTHKDSMGLMGITSIPVFLRGIASAFAEKRDKRAEMMYEKAVEAAEDVSGFQPEVLEYTLGDCAEFYVNINQGDKAQKIMKRLAELRLHLYGHNNLEYAGTLLGLSAILHEMRRTAEADGFSARAVSILEDMDARADLLIKALELRVSILRQQNRHLDANAAEKRKQELLDRQQESVRKAPEA
jgi:tetratricopeptide (TPR) repeat protein